MKKQNANPISQCRRRLLSKKRRRSQTAPIIPSTAEAVREKPNKRPLTLDKIKLTNSDTQDMLLDMGFSEYRAAQIQRDFFSSLAECCAPALKIGDVASEVAAREIMIASIRNIMLELSPEEMFKTEGSP
jgi:hypothetical protein